MPLTATLATLFERDLAALRREVESYPDEQQLWATIPGQPNSGGVLVLHLCGNLQHFIGAGLGGSSYVRDRDREFTGPPSSRARLLDEIDRTRKTIADTLPRLTPAQLSAEYPLPFGTDRIGAELFLVHLAVHLGFHLGQVDYHRRAVTGGSKSVAPMGVEQLARA